MGGAAVLNDKLGKERGIKGKVTYAYIGALSRFGRTVFHASPPFYILLHHAGNCLTWKKIINGVIICVEGMAVGRAVKRSSISISISNLKRAV
jgi:hypothetical protein